MKPKPRIFWTYYPKSRRGYWRVSPKPKWRYQAEWRKAYIVVGAMNAEAEKRAIYRAEYNRQLRLRVTT